MLKRWMSPLALYFESEVLLSTGIGLVTYAQPFLFAHGGMSDAQIGLLFGVNSFAGGVAAFVLGSITDWFGVSRVWKAATLGIGIGYLLLGLWGGFVPWLAASTVAGSAAGLLMATENVVLSSLTPRGNKAAVLSRFVALYMAAIGAGMVLGGVLGARVGYPVTVLIGAALALAAPCIRVWVKAPDVKADKALRRPSLRLARMSVYSFGLGAAVGIFTPFATLVLKQRFALGDVWVAVISAAGTFSVSATSYLVSRAVERWRRERVVAATMAVAGVSSLGLAGAGGAVPFAVLYLLRSAFASAPGPVVDAMFLERTPPTEHGQMFGLRVFANTLGNAVASACGGWLLNHGQLWLALCVSTALFAATYGYLRVL
ncbi:MAG: MFS transporter [Alicyclobacillus herbarius]|uniref:MFS transporter n=1 Tax=Alicyclobacillus herbarius TaxID=122960 RepID=UPI002356C38E|nr:MFS transporter [Alicyclobacillus herbarius]MCL6634050.1 MFS transporter [Alicyclobacillus herbarius]